MGAIKSAFNLALKHLSLRYNDENDKREVENVSALQTINSKRVHISFPCNGGLQW